VYAGLAKNNAHRDWLLNERLPLIMMSLGLFIQQFPGCFKDVPIRINATPEAGHDERRRHTDR